VYVSIDTGDHVFAVSGCFYTFLFHGDITERFERNVFRKRVLIVDYEIGRIEAFQPISCLDSSRN
jgi:hypothetical protein